MACHVAAFRSPLAGPLLGVRHGGAAVPWGGGVRPLPWTADVRVQLRSQGGLPRGGGGRAEATRRRTPCPCRCVSEGGEAMASASGLAVEDKGTDEIFSCMGANAEVSLLVVLGTELVKEAQRRHNTAPTATAALGRLLLGTLLLGALKGGEETVQVMFAGRGDIGRMTAVCSLGSLVKGYVDNPSCDPPLTPRGKMDVGAAVGPGVLTVVRSHPAWQSPYTGTVPLQTGEVAEDLAHYLADSEQIFSAISLGVSVGRDGMVKAAGGFLLQVLPGCSEETLAQVEANVQAMPPMSELAGAEEPYKIAARLLAGFGVDERVQTVVPKFGPCSVEDLKPRMLRAVESLGADDIRLLLQEQGHVEVRCEFCAEVVQFQEEGLQALLKPPSDDASGSV